jgi:Zn-dependent protease
MLSDQSIHGFLLLAPVFIISLTLHELAHGLTAYKLGDRTAKEMGRLTLNPIAHMDPLGSLILVVTYFGGSFLFGWA